MKFIPDVLRHKLYIFSIVVLVFTGSMVAFAGTDDPDLTVVTEIRQEGFRHSQVMNILTGLTDEIGPRLTGSPNMKKANEWTRERLTEFGLVNAHLEPWGPFGRGWSNEFTSVRMLSPDTAMLYALAKAWTNGTAGAVKADSVLMRVESKDDLAQFHGKLAGKIVLVLSPKLPRRDEESGRYDEKQLADIVNYSVSNRMESLRGAILKQRALSRDIGRFLLEEKALAVVERSHGEGGLLF